MMYNVTDMNSKPGYNKTRKTQPYSHLTNLENKETFDLEYRGKLYRT